MEFWFSIWSTLCTKVFMTLAGPMMHSTTDNLAFLLRVTVKTTKLLFYIMGKMYMTF